MKISRMEPRRGRILASAAALIMLCSLNATAFSGMGKTGSGSANDSSAGMMPAHGEDAKNAAEKKNIAPWKDDEVLIKLGGKGQLTYGELKNLFPKWAKSQDDLTGLDEKEQIRFVKRYFNELLFAEEAKVRGYENSLEFRKRTLANRFRLLMPVYKRREYVDKIKPTDEELYQHIPPAEDEVQLRIIVKQDLNKAKALYERAVAGEDFETLVRSESEGNLREMGGLTGFMSPHNSSKFPPPVVEGFLKARVGEILPPSYQDIGYLVVKVEGKRTAAELRKEELERRRSEIIFNLHKHAYEARLEELKKKAKVEMNAELIDAYAKGKENSPSEVVVHVNGIGFRADEVFAEMLNAGHGGQPINQRADSFVETAIIGLEAQRLGLESDPLFLSEWVAVQGRELSRELIRVEVAGIESAAVTVDDLKAYAIVRPDKFIEPEARKLRLILVENPKNAGKALERLKKGEDFSAVAKELSVDQTTRSSGGDLGFLIKKAVPEVFGEQVFTMKEGEYTDPAIGVVSSVDGRQLWAIVKVESVLKGAPMPPESVKSPTIENEIRTLKRTERLKNLIKELSAKHGYEMCIPNGQ